MFGIDVSVYEKIAMIVRWNCLAVSDVVEDALVMQTAMTNIVCLGLHTFDFDFDKHTIRTVA